MEGNKLLPYGIMKHLITTMRANEDTRYIADELEKVTIEDESRSYENISFSFAKIIYNVGECMRITALIGQTGKRYNITDKSDRTDKADKSNKSSKQDKSRGNLSSKHDTVCYSCGRPGHTRKECKQGDHPDRNTESGPFCDSTIGKQWLLTEYGKQHKRLDPNHRLDGTAFIRTKEDKGDKGKKHYDRYVLSTTPTSSHSIEVIEDLASLSIKPDTNIINIHLSFTQNTQIKLLSGIAVLDTGSTLANYISDICYSNICKLNSINLIENSFITPTQHCVCNSMGSCTNNLDEVKVSMTFTDEITGDPTTLDIVAYILKGCPIDILIGRPTIKENSLCLRLPSQCFIEADVKAIVRLMRTGLCGTCGTTDQVQYTATGHSDEVHHDDDDIASHTNKSGKRKPKWLLPTSTPISLFTDRIPIKEVLSYEEPGTEDDGILDEDPYPWEQTEATSDPLNSGPKDLQGSESLIESLQNLSTKYLQAFGRGLRKEAAKWDPMIIDIKEDDWKAAHIPQMLREMSESKRDEMERQLILLKEAEIIEPSNCSKYSQVHMVPKKDADGNKTTGSWRFTVDYRLINSLTEKSGWPLHKIKDIITRIGRSKSKYFGVIDLTHGYFQAPLSKESRKYTAFRTISGTYQFTRVAMGLKGAGSYFQQRMSTVVLKNLVPNGIEVYIDDIIFYAATEEEFIELVESVFKRLIQYNIIIHPDKCHLGLESIEILGHTINKDGVTFSDEKCAMVANFKKPVYQQQLKSFLGLANYFRDSIKNYSIISGPLQDTLKAYSPRKILIWNQAADEAFNLIRTIILKLPQRFFLSEGMDIVIETDASDYGIGAFLYQIEIKSDGSQLKRPIEFISKSLSSTQQRWNTTEKECYAIVFALKKWEQLLIDKRFTLLSDHQNLQYINDTGSNKVLRWKLFLLEFNFYISYIKGEDNIVADALSRCVELEDALTEPASALSACLTWSKDHQLREDIVNVAASSFAMTEAAQDKLLKQEFMKIHNDLTGHIKINACMKILSKSEGVGKLGHVREKVKRMIKECVTCQLQNRSAITANTAPFVINTDVPMQKICMDTNGPFPPDNNGYRYILVITCAFSRWVELYPLKSLESEETALKLIEYFTRFQVPELILTDNGSQFKNEIIDQLCEITGIESLKTIPYSSQENGIGERINREIIKHLEAFCIGVNKKKRWSEYLPFVRRIINSSYHSTIGTSPASIIYGNRINQDWIYAPREFRDIELNGKTFGSYMKDSLEFQDEVIIKAIEFQEAINDQNIAKRLDARSDIPFQEFQVGDWVLMESRENKAGGLKRPKLQTPRQGPFKIIARSGNNYTIRSPGKGRNRSVRVDQITSFEYDRATTDPEEIAIESNDDLYIVEAIEGYKGRPGSKDIQFRIRWKDYPDEKDKTWSTFADLHANGTINTIFQEWLQETMKTDTKPERWNKYIRSAE